MKINLKKKLIITQKQKAMELPHFVNLHLCKNQIRLLPILAAVMSDGLECHLWPIVKYLLVVLVESIKNHFELII
jgi:hypothetical protein